MIIISKLYFRHGCMNSSKTANLLMVIHNYEEQGKKVLVFKPSVDTRSSKGYIESRVGIRHECIDIGEEFNIHQYVSENIDDYSCILMDECHFATSKHILQLVRIVDKLNIPVICFGLKNSYVQGELFESIKTLLYYADSIEEIKTVCQYCNKKATMNLRIVDGKPIYDGNTVKCGDINSGEDYYIPTYRKHYFKPNLY